MSQNLLGCSWYILDEDVFASTVVSYMKKKDADTSRVRLHLHDELHIDVMTLYVKSVDHESNTFCFFPEMVWKMIFCW